MDALTLDDISDKLEVLVEEMKQTKIDDAFIANEVELYDKLYEENKQLEESITISNEALHQVFNV